jgi:hypothetical protein
MTEASRGHRAECPRFLLFCPPAGLPGGKLKVFAQPIGIKAAGQQVVNRDVVGSDLAGKHANKAG